jgi:hypothetical protein
LCPIAIAPPPQYKAHQKAKEKITHGDVKLKFPHLASHHSNKKQKKI